jgi:hypothetical protein
MTADERAIEKEHGNVQPVATGELRIGIHVDDVDRR